VGKADKLLQNIGDNIAESVGSLESAHGGPALAEPKAMKDDRQTGRTRYREAGLLDLDRIAPDPDQPRKSFEKQPLQDLADSIAERGVLQPIGVRWNSDLGKWLITWGERRYRAATLAGLESIPCIFAEDEQDEADIRIQQLIENCLREGLPPMEEALAYQSLLETTGWSKRRLAQELHIGKTSVLTSLALLKLPDDLQQQVVDRELSPGVAYELTQVRDETQQKKLARRVVDEGLTRDQVRELVREPSVPPSPRPDVEPPARSAADQSAVRTFTTRRSTVSIEMKIPNATTADIQQELLAVVKQLGSSVATGEQPKDRSRQRRRTK